MSMRWIGAAVLVAMLSGATTLAQDQLPGGALNVLDNSGKSLGSCPLKHTDVKADITGFIARVTVTQQFHNPSETKIEAIYVFPLSQNAAVDAMTMTVGDRRIVGVVKERDEARRVYEQAKAAGHVAGLLDQERPNIFTQAVANIEPGADVTIEISYVETLDYADGGLNWVFPMVVGPRYIPGGGSATAPGQTGRPTGEVPDGDRVTPPVTPEGTRAGHDISLNVTLTAGFELRDLASESHAVKIDDLGFGRRGVTLVNEATIPNRDFVLRAELAAEDIGDAFFVHEDERGRFFTLILQPPKRVAPQNVVPRELIFVLDTSGSMWGFPIEKAKAVMSKLVDTMGPRDTFNIITFAGDTRILWDKPRPNTEANRQAAQEFLLAQQGGGGTEMMMAIRAALEPTASATPKILTPLELANQPADNRFVYVLVSLDKVTATPGGGALLRARDDLTIKTTWTPPTPTEATQREWVLAGVWETRDGQRVLTCEEAQPRGEQLAAPMRIVCFMTDGYVGNDMAIIDAVKQNADSTRVFSFGVGNSVNRFLLDGMAHAGRGEAEYVLLEGQGDAAVERFYERILAPVLADVSVDWGDLPASDVYPQRVPDLFASKPIVIHGRLDEPRAGTITLRGRTGAGLFEREVRLEPELGGKSHAALASLWARAKVDDLMQRDLKAAQQGTFPEDLKRKVIDLGVNYRLVTQFTSFVAVEELTVTAGGEPTTVKVPVEMPDGVSYQGVFESAGSQRYVACLSGPPGGSAGNAGAFSKRAMGRGSPPSVVAEEALPSGDATAADKDDDAAELDASLKGLAERVERNGRDGNLTADGVKVVGWRVDVMITFSTLDDSVRQKLTALGFKLTGESKATRLLIGSIDVRKLDELLELEGVTTVKPVKQD